MYIKQFLKLALSLSVAVSCSCSWQCLSAQTLVTHELNGIRGGDMLNKQEVEYMPPGDDGENSVWDISNLEEMADYPIEYCCDSDSLNLLEITPVAINSYRVTKDSLYLIGYEMPLKKILYNKPILNITFPFVFGQHEELDYEGHGTYCQTHAMESFGTASIEADATGYLVIAEEDTLKNAIRVHSIRTGSLGIYPNESAALEHTNMKQEIEDRFLWYVRGYRYPVFETISTSYYDNMDFVSCVKVAYRYLPDRQRALKDEANNDILIQDSLSDISGADIIHYTLDYGGGILTLNYDLDSKATLNVVVCNKMGIMSHKKNECIEAGTAYQMQFNCSGLRPDDYILYINVNGKVYSEKFKVD